jgi:hypothetical protein
MIIWGKQITPEQRAIPWYKFAIMGALDGIAGVMQTFATNFINSGALLILLQQSAIPISMIITKYMLKVKYAVWNYVGALIVVIGLIIVLLPSMLNSDDSEPKLFFVWVAVMLVSCIPMTLSSVYKEKALGETEIDVVYLNGWVAVYQLIVTLIFAVPCGYANEPPIPPKDLPKNLYDGLLCYVGITVNNTLDAGNSTMTTNSTMMSTMSMMNMSTSAMSSTASTMMMNMSSVMPTMMMMMNDSSGNHTQVLGHCDGSGSLSSPLAVNVYMAFNILYNVFIILILKYGGSNVLWLAMTLMVPLGNAAFALPFVPGNKPMTPFDGVGLVVIMIGLIFYRFWAPLTKFLPHNSRVWLARFSLGPPLPRDDEDESTIDQTGSVKYPLLGSVMSVEAVDPIYVVRPERKLIRTQHQIRSAYFARLGIGAPDRVSFCFCLFFSRFCGSFSQNFSHSKRLPSMDILNKNCAVVVIHQCRAQLSPILFARAARCVDHNVVGARIAIVDTIELFVAFGVGFVAILVVGKRLRHRANVGQRQRANVSRERRNRVAATWQQPIANRLCICAKFTQQKAQRTLAQVALQVHRETALLVEALAQKQCHKRRLTALDDAHRSAKVASGNHLARAIVDLDVHVTALRLEQEPRELANRHTSLGRCIAECTADRPELGTARFGHVEAQRRLACQLVAGNQQHRLGSHLSTKLL